MIIGRLAAMVMLPSVSIGSALGADNDSKPDKSAIVFACDATHNACLDACQRANNGINVLSRADRQICEDKCTEIYAQCINSAAITKTTKAPRASQRVLVGP